MANRSSTSTPRYIRPHAGGGKTAGESIDVVWYWDEDWWMAQLPNGELVKLVEPPEPVLAAAAKYEAGEIRQADFPGHDVRAGTPVEAVTFGRPAVTRL